MAEPEQPQEESAAASTGEWIEEHVVPLLREPTLGPVWVVIVAHLAAFGAWALLLAVQEGRVSALLGVFGLFWLTGTGAWVEIRARGRPGAISAWILAVWATTAVFYFGALHYGIF